MQNKSMYQSKLMIEIVSKAYTPSFSKKWTLPSNIPTNMNLKK
jgi:hypothetical protein